MWRRRDATTVLGFDFSMFRKYQIGPQLRCGQRKRWIDTQGDLFSYVFHVVCFLAYFSSSIASRRWRSGISLFRAMHHLSAIFSFLPCFFLHPHFQGLTLVTNAYFPFTITTILLLHQHLF
ncbi:hypothetical protein B0J11DRAFT_533466 [Dendryphion nanum]|uniref:Uncharacterized protein n=1 Tax=Dendryphion nanum TaxID=256645 RepID=A0A9P9IJ31_9PLEO|nr:hypothetical protein B0J11DRAFT_533466 [Dendryphion nanum]